MRTIREIVLMIFLSLSFICDASQHSKNNVEERLKETAAYIVSSKNGGVSTGTYCSFQGEYFILTCAHGHLTSQINSGDLTIESIVFSGSDNLTLTSEDVEAVIYSSELNYLSHATDHAKIILKKPIAGITPFPLKFRPVVDSRGTFDGIVLGYGIETSDLEVLTLPNGKEVARYTMHEHRPYFVRANGSVYGDYLKIKKMNVRIKPTIQLPQFITTFFSLISRDENLIQRAYYKANLESDVPFVKGFSGSLVVDSEGFFHGVCSSGEILPVDKMNHKLGIVEEEGLGGQEKEYSYLTKDGFHSGKFFSKVSL